MNARWELTIVTGIPCAKTRLAVSYARVVRTKSRMETSVQVMISLPYGIGPVPAPRKVNFLCLMKKISNRKEKNTGQNRPVVCNYLSQFYGLNFHEERSGALHDSELAYVLEHLQCNENILFCRLSFPLGPRWHGQPTNVSHFSFPYLPIFTSTIF